MSRVGNRRIPIKKNVKVQLGATSITVSGPKGTLEQSLPPGISVDVTDDHVAVKCAESGKESKALHGLGRNLIQNMIVGVEQGFKKELTIHGVGYRAQVQGKRLVLNVGFSHPVEYNIPKGLTIGVVENTRIMIEGVDKQLVGQAAAEIRAVRSPEPYKGKGIRYANEHIVMKEGKTV